MAIDNIISRLDMVKRTGDGKYQARCPAHDDKSPSLSLRELQDGRILMHCFGGCSAGDVMDSIGLALSDLFEEPLEDRIRPLYMARQEKRKLGKINDELKACQLRLDMAKDMRARGEKMSKADLETERQAFLRKRQLTGGSNGNTERR